MVKVCGVVDSKLANGHYSELRASMTRPPPGIFHWRRAKKAKLSEWHIDSEDERAGADKKKQAPRRLDVQTLVDHYAAHGPSGTYVVKNRVHDLSDGTKAVKVYVFPKYTLSFRWPRRIVGTCCSL